ncbi:uncharacterized protein [Rutidosis leptorrhynchoides]|uniref:uncharacterized protein n=1 Tax=Rutidosis leptorrhynchoides TaxID=125765 RepID=UPI003A998BEA
MASPVPAKSQLLHNFSLPHLKWKNHRTGRNRLAGELSSSLSPPPYVSRRPSPLQNRESESESESKPNSAIAQIQKPKTITEKSTKSIDNKLKRSNKICIRFRKNDAVPDQNESVTTEQEDESSPKIWNLRPRRPPMNHKQLNGNLPKIGSSPLPENKSSHNREATEPKVNDRTDPMTLKRTKFSISLTRDEIEEDLFSITGLKPSRRPKKRSKTVQRQLDTLFPGLWLGSITVDTYKVSEAS